MIYPSSLRTHAFAGTTNERTRRVASLPRRDARCEDRFEVLRTVAVSVNKIFIRDAAQLSTEFAGHAHGVELGALAHDRLNGVDMMRDQIARHLVKIGRVLDDPAEALGGGASGRVSESSGVALDVMGSAKQLLAGEFRKTVLANCRVGGREPVGFDRHPVLEIA